MTEYFNHAGTTPPFQQTGNYHFANRFTTNQAVVLNSIWWYFDGAGHNKPEHLVIWDVTTNIKLLDATDAPTATAEGWQQYNLAAPGLALVSGHEFSAGISDDQGMRWRAWATAPPAVNNPPFSHIGVRYGNGVGIPTATASWELFALSLDTTGGTPGGGGATPAEVAAELAKWLSNVAATNTHQTDGLPWQTKLDTGAIRTVTDRLNALSNAAITRLNNLSDAAINALNAASEGANSWMGDVKARLTGSSGGGGSAFYGPGGTQVSAGVEILLSGGTLNAAKLNAILGLPTFPNAPWVQLAEIAFDTNLAWDQDADLYSVHFATLGSNIVNTTVAGVPVSYRLAWWAPLNANHAHSRKFIDFPDAHCLDNGRRMPGLLLRSNAGGTGTVQAWQLPT